MERNSNANGQPQNISPPTYVSQHEELIKYVQEAWRTITNDKGHAPVFYKSDKSDTNSLNGFIPFDLESYWGRRQYQAISALRHS